MVVVVVCRGAGRCIGGGGGGCHRVDGGNGSDERNWYY